MFPGREYYFPERNQQDTHLAETVADITSGQLAHVDSVFAFNPHQHICVDVSKEVAQAVLDRAHVKGTELSYDARGFIHGHLGAEACP